MISLESKIEGLLFFKGEEMSIKKLSEIFEVSVSEIEQSLTNLNEAYTQRGLVLVRNGEMVVLGVSGELSPIIESIRKEELTKELSKASLETLSIILYKNGVTRSEVDYIRGVNSSFIIRNLLVRGLIEKTIDPKDSRRILYRPTTETLAYMGVTTITALPNYDEVSKSLTETLVSYNSSEN